ncbi:TPA: glucosamine inositolphosphorylceramide transferase family protein [Providencia alcalifaciens]
MSFDITHKKYNTLYALHEFNSINHVSISVNNIFQFSIPSIKRNIDKINIIFNSKKPFPRKIKIEYVIYFEKNKEIKIEIQRRIINSKEIFFFDSFAFELFFIINFSFGKQFSNQNISDKNTPYYSTQKRDKTDNIFKRIFDRFFRRDEWMVAYHNSIVSPENISTCFNKFSILKNKKKSFSADPFIIDNNGFSYIFYEECPLKKGGKGYIVCLDINSGKSEIILEEAYHLSYPNVFKIDNDFYMIPQSENHCIDLYRATEFPYKWEKCKTILQHKAFNFGDTNIYFTENSEINITTSPYDHSFNSNRIRVSWKITDLLSTNSLAFEDCTILSMSDEFSRNAGNSSVQSDALYQNCLTSYGGGLVRKIDSRIVYIENPKNTTGMHTYNISNNYTVIDIKKNKYGIFL